MLFDPDGKGAMLYLLVTHKSYRQPAFKMLFLAAQMCYLTPAEILIMDVAHWFFSVFDAGGPDFEN